MATDKDMINFALKVRPTAIFHQEHGLELFTLSRIVVLDAGILRSAVETRMGRPLSWEEWVDVRSAYARHHAAVELALLEGDPFAQLQRAVYRPPVGTNYILAEEV